MPRDRFTELPKRAHFDDSGEDDDENDEASDFTIIEMDDLGGISAFFTQIKQLRILILELEEDVDKVTQLRSKIISTPVPDAKTKLETDDLMATIKTSSEVIRAKLKDIGEQIKKGEEASEEPDVVTADLRIRKTQYSTMRRKFIEIMNSYQMSQTTYRDRCKDRIKRQLEITGSSLSEDQVEEMIEKGNFAVFTKGIVMATEQAKQMVVDVQARHNDILNLEKSITDLHGLFLELAKNVELQGEIIDNRIEVNMANTQAYVQKAKKEIARAVEHQTNARKKQFYIYGIGFVVLVILIIIISLSIAL